MERRLPSGEKAIVWQHRVFPLRTFLPVGISQIVQWFSANFLPSREIHRQLLNEPSVSSKKGFTRFSPPVATPRAITKATTLGHPRSMRIARLLRAERDVWKVSYGFGETVLPGIFGQLPPRLSVLSDARVTNQARNCARVSRTSAPPFTLGLLWGFLRITI